MQTIRMWFLLLDAFASFPWRSWATECSNPGILVEIHNRQVHGRENLLRYGLSFGLGTPSQNDSLWPAITHNETAFSAPDYCDSSRAQSCLENARGFFAAQDSSTWQNLSEFQALDSPPFDSRAARLNGQDTLSIWQTTNYGDPQTLITVDQFPTMLLSNLTTSADATSFFGPGGLLGLGPSSTILTRLVEGGLIAARSFGLYLGPTPNSPDGDKGGALVLGGYDCQRFRGPVATYEQVSALSQSMLSPFRVSIDQVRLVTSGGQRVIDLADDSFDAYISTDRRPLQFPPRVTAKFADALQAVAAGNEENTLRLPTAFEGNLTITLSNNLTLTYDSSWLADSSQLTPISAAPLQLSALGIDNLPGDNSFPVILGAAFLSQVYMFVNYDAVPPNFALAQALLDVNKIQQRPYCAGEELVAAQTMAATSGSSSRKALIGGLCGGLLGGLLVAIVFFIFRRHRNTKVPGTHNYSHFSNEEDSHHQHRRAVIRTFQHWRSRARKAILSIGLSKKDGYDYKDIDTGQNKKSHVSAIMFTAGDVEKDCNRLPLAETSYDVYTAMKDSVPSQHKEESGEQNLTQAIYSRELTPPPNSLHRLGSEIVSPGTVRAHNSLNLALFSGPAPLSAHNKQQRTQSLQLNQAPNSRTVEDGTYEPSPSPQQRQVTVTVREQAVFDKSLPATPAASTPRFPSPIAQQLPFRQPDFDMTLLDGWQGPGNTTTSTNSSGKQMLHGVPPVPAIPSGFVTAAPEWISDDSYAFPSLAAHDRQNSGEYKTSAFDNLSLASSSTKYAFWRKKQCRSFATNTSFADSIAPSRGSFSSSKPAVATVKDTSTTQPKQRQKSHSRQRTSTRTRVAMAARISRLKELQQTGVREIVIRKRGKGKTQLQSDSEARVVATEETRSAALMTMTMTMTTAPAANLAVQANVTKRDPSTLSRKPQTRVATVPSGINIWTDTMDLDTPANENVDANANANANVDLDIRQGLSLRSSTVSSSSWTDGHRPLSPVSAFSEAYEQGTTRGDRSDHAGDSKTSTTMRATTIARKSLPPPLPPLPAVYAQTHAYSNSSPYAPLYAQHHTHVQIHVTDTEIDTTTNSNDNINTSTNINTFQSHVPMSGGSHMI